MRILLSVIVVLSLSNPLTADANPVCRWIGLCVYLSPGFVVTVVDAETGKPLPEVYGWAEWTQYGAHGRGGPLMVQDATGSTARPSPPFLAGVQASAPPAASCSDSTRRSSCSSRGTRRSWSRTACRRAPTTTQQSAACLAMANGSASSHSGGRRCNGSSSCRQLVFPALSYGSEADGQRFQDVYLRRLEHVESQLTQLPSHVPEVASLRSSLELERRHFAGGRR